MNVTTALKSIRDERRKQHLTQKDMADRIGVCTLTYARYENEETSMPLWAYLAILKELGYSVGVTKGGEA